jgi:hypothetical protein
MPKPKEPKKPNGGPSALEDLSTEDLLRSIRKDLEKKLAPEPLADPQPPAEPSESE